MALGWKAWETRGWSTSYRGPLAIHAAKNMSAIKDLTPMGLEDLAYETCGVKLDLPKAWPLGSILCVVDLVDCVPTEKAQPGPLETLLGNYMPKRHAWMTKNLRRVKPILFKGWQGLRDLPGDVEKAFKYV
jgi:hypothetical protein